MSTGLYTAFIVGTLTVVGWCTAQEYVTGSVTTDREMYYVGENLTVHCFLSQPVASNASFEYGPGTMPSDYVTVVNETYLRLDKQLTETDLPDSSCACFIGDEIVGDVLDIRSEYRPQNVTNLNHEYCNKKDFCASWSLGVEYRLGLHTKRQGWTTTMITAEYANDSDHGPWMKCDLWQNGTGCVARNLNGWTQLSLRVTVTNVRRNDTAVTQFDRLALVSDEGMTRVTTEKPLYYVGENMTVHCFLERTGASDASFVYGSDTLSRDYVLVVNETYLRLDRQVTAMDPFKAPCFCVDGDKKTVGSAYILTEYRPQNVTDVKFEYYDQETFHASWSIDVNYKSGTPTLNTSITVIKAEYTGNITHGPWNDCKLSEDSSGCTTRGKDGWPHLSLRVTVANIKRNDSAIALFYNLYLDAIVKPAPVDIRRTEILNSTCAKVVWWSNKYYPLYRITWDVTTLNTSEEQITICSLRPFRTYTVSVQALPRSGFPGVVQIVTLHMPEDAPSTGPKLTEGGYYRQGCSTGKNQSEHVYICFMPVPPEDRNSATLNYTAKLYMDDQETQALHLQDPESNMLTVSVPCGQGFSVTMYATNRVGVSPQTNLTVPADDKAPGTGPKLTERGNYRQRCSTGKDQSAQVYIYFMPVPPENRNSATLNYTAKLYMDDQETQKLHLEDPENNMLTVSVPCGQEFSVTMYATKRAGVSPQTNLTVPADDKDITSKNGKVSTKTSETPVSSMPQPICYPGCSSINHQSDSKRDIDELYKDYLKKSILFRKKQLEKIKIEIALLKKEQQIH